MNRTALIFLLLVLTLSCRTVPREEGTAPRELVSPRPVEFKFIAPEGGGSLRSAPDTMSKTAGHLGKNAKVKVLERSREKTEIDGKSGYWTKVEAESDSGIITGWIHEGYLSSSAQVDGTNLPLDIIAGSRDSAPPGRILGKFQLGRCEYGPDHSGTPYFFLGARKQYFNFHEDGSCTFDVNICGGTSPEEGTFRQEGRTLTAEIGREKAVFEIINRNTLKLTKGSGHLSCYVCREAWLIRSE